MKRILIWAAFLMMGGASSPLNGQDEQVADIYSKMGAEVSDLRGKLGELAQEFPEELWDWRPMEGVRSLKDVMAVVTAEGTALLGSLGMPVPDGIGSDFAGEIGRLSALSKTELLAEYELSTHSLEAAIAGLSGPLGEGTVRFFGREMTRWAAMDGILDDQHQHLGQLIAYARMNHIVPPWSR